FRSNHGDALRKRPQLLVACDPEESIGPTLCSRPPPCYSDRPRPSSPELNPCEVHGKRGVVKRSAEYFLVDFKYPRKGFRCRKCINVVGSPALLRASCESS